MEDEELAERQRTLEHPGGVSALRRATRTNRRTEPCPTCRMPNRLTPADVRRSYQCDECANRDEGAW